MNPSSSCPGPERLRALLNDAVSDRDREDLTRHVESCPACLRQLERMAEERQPLETWPEAPVERDPPGNRTPGQSPELESTRLDPSGAETMADDPAVDDLALDFLKPSEKPGHLGCLGRYEVLQRIGRGSMGVVFKGFDSSLLRVVAIKVLAPRLASSPTSRRRFTREAQAAAAVSHDHLVTIYEVAEDGGLPYLVMPYIRGRSLQDRIDREGPLELREILRIGMQTASGLAAAHAQGLVHRDIKPSNILLEDGVERVKITDFGLARAADDASLTQPGIIAGTPQYMAPEQAQGGRVDQRSDLFSLGSVLYAMCTGHPPFRAGSAVAVLRRVADETPRPVQEINPLIPDWLSAVIEKLHAKDPAGRYASAAEVADVLGRLLAGLQQGTLNVGTQRTRPGWFQRPRRLAAIAAGVLLLALTAGLAAGAWRVFRDLGPGIDRAEIPGKFQTPSPPRPPFARTVLFEKSGKLVHVLAFSRDGTILVSGDSVGNMKVWDLASNQVRQPLTGHTDGVFCLAFAPDGATLASGSWDHSVIVWNLRTGARLRTLRKHTEPVFGLAFTPDGATLITGGKDSQIVFWNAASGEPTRVLDPEGAVRALAVSPDGRTLAVALNEGPRTNDLQLWDIASGELRSRLEGHTGPLDAVAFAPDGRMIATGSHDGTARLWDALTGREVRTFPGHAYSVRGVSFAPDGTVLATCASDYLREDLPGELKLWDTTTGASRADLSGHRAMISCVAFAPDGQTMASGAADATIILWDISGLGIRGAPRSPEASGRLSLAGKSIRK